MDAKRREKQKISSKLLYFVAPPPALPIPSSSSSPFVPPPTVSLIHFSSSGCPVVAMRTLYDVRHWARYYAIHMKMLVYTHLLHEQVWPS